VVDPTRGITVVGSARLCKFIQCVSGTASNTCPAGTTAETSPDGLPGCCGTDDFQMDTDCSGIDDDATVFIRLDQATDSCAKYTLTFHY
jgi:hypothetical protein